MSDCKSYVSKEDLQALKESQQHIEHVARSRNAAGEKALLVTDTIRGENVTNRTLDGLEDIYNSAIRDMGWITMDSFQQGAEITKRNEILRDETNGEYYRWDGDLPKSVPSGSTPESSGGVDMGAWVSVGDASLRTELKGVKGYELIPSISNDLIPNIKKSFSLASSLGITSDLDDCSDALMVAIESKKHIVFEPGMYRFKSTLNVNLPSDTISFVGYGVRCDNVAKNTTPHLIDDTYCKENNIVAFVNEDTDFFKGSCTISVENIVFLSKTGENAKQSTPSPTSCFIEHGGVLNIYPLYCSFFQWDIALDLKLNSHSKHILFCKFQHCNKGVDLSGVVFNSKVLFSYFVENIIGVHLGSGNQCNVSDNEFALDAAKSTIGIKTDTISNTSLERNYFEDYGDINVPKQEIGALAYDLGINPYSNSPGSISLFGNIANMQNRSDYCARIANAFPTLKTNTKGLNLDEVQFINYKNAQYLIKDGENLGLQYVNAVLQGNHLKQKNNYNCIIGSLGQIMYSNGGVTCLKTGTGKYTIKVDFGRPTGQFLAPVVSGYGAVPVTTTIENSTHDTVFIGVYENGTPVDYAFCLSIQV